MSDTSQRRPVGSTAHVVHIQLPERRFRVALHVLHRAWEQEDCGSYFAYLDALLIGLAEAA